MAEVSLRGQLTRSELVAIVSKSIVPIVLTLVPHDPLVSVPQLIVVIVLTLVTNGSIVLHCYYCIVTLLSFATYCPQLD